MPLDLDTTASDEGAGAPAEIAVTAAMIAAGSAILCGYMGSEVGVGLREELAAAVYEVMERERMKVVTAQASS